MADITLIRHGQARAGAKTEHDYDRLSDTGTSQARWLGEYLQASSREFDRIFCGALNRQRDTATIIGDLVGVPVTVDPRLDEFDYFGLAESMKQRTGATIPTSRPEFMQHIPEVFDFWQRGVIDTPVESFETFEARVNSALCDAEIGSERVMLVTSGGVISMALRHILGLQLRAFSHILLQIHNTSMHRYVVENDTRFLDGFNATPHLDAPDRVAARTFI